MTLEQAIVILNGFNGVCYDDGDEIAIQMAIEALEKQIPKKAKNINLDLHEFDCPTCNKTIIYLDKWVKHKNCLRCGQKLDWSELE